MTIWTFDTETALIAPGLLAPPLTCLTCVIDTQHRADLLNRHEAIGRMADVLASDAIIVGQNVAFDMAVLASEEPALLPAIFAAYAADRVTDTMLRQQLADIADGKFGGYLDAKNVWRKRDYSLAALSARLLGRTLEKDEWRLRYSEFRDVPIEQWPEGAREYPRIDAESTRDVFMVQERDYGPEILADQYRQARAYWGLHLMAAWGVHCDADAVETLRRATDAAYKAVTADLVTAGLVRLDGSRDTKAAKVRMRAVVAEPRLTAGGDVSLDEEACTSSGDDLLEDYATYSTLGKTISTDLPMLQAAIHLPLHTSYGMAETGRTTSRKNRALGGSGGNIQNLRRLPGIRECIVPRPGNVFIQADYAAFELFCLAQSCLDFVGSSTLGDALNGGLDPHCVVAGKILGRDYADVIAHKKDPDVDNARQTAKVANFGFPGGLGAARLVHFAKKSYDVTITEPEARALKAQWLASWPEMRMFFAYINTRERDNGYVIQCPRSKRYRSGCSYTAACNTTFQGVAADAAKHAVWLVSRACYVGSGPLAGVRPIIFAHDEIIAECSADRAPEAAEELSRIMVDAARVFLPDMAVRAEPCIMSRWSKKAETLRDATGRLMVWS